MESTEVVGAVTVLDITVAGIVTLVVLALAMWWLDRHDWFYKPEQPASSPRPTDDEQMQRMLAGD